MVKRKDLLDLLTRLSKDSRDELLNVLEEIQRFEVRELDLERRKLENFQKRIAAANNLLFLVILDLLTLFTLFKLLS